MDFIRRKIFKKASKNIEKEYGCSQEKIYENKIIFNNLIKFCEDEAKTDLEKEKINEIKQLIENLENDTIANQISNYFYQQNKEIFEEADKIYNKYKKRIKYIEKILPYIFSLISLIISLLVLFK